MAISQSLQQRQQMRLLPQQIQLMKLLQVPTANLEQRIKEEIEENPALELEAEELPDTNETVEEDPLQDYANEDNEFENSDDGDYGLDDLNIDDYADNDDVAEYRTRDDNYPEFGEKPSNMPRVETDFHDVLASQLGTLDLDDRLRRVAEQIVGSIDDDGYLRREVSSIVDDLAFRQNIMATDAEVEMLIRQIQSFDPPGVCARDLQECLLLQLRRQKAEGKPVDLAITIIEKYFDEFTKKHFEKIQRSLGIEEDEMRDTMGSILKLNPRPGGNVGDINKAETYIIPDFYIINNNGVLEMNLNARNAPDLRISQEYKEMFRDYERSSKQDKRQKEALLFVKQKIDSAKWFIDIINQRYETLTKTMLTIMKHQEAFFLTGDETNLRPMILKDIADKTDLDISTVSRVANSKFVQTEFGTYKLKFFFSESLNTDSGEEVSTREVKKILSDIVEAEDKRKPLSDDTLTEMLNDKGYQIARRTVAKYREQLNIPVARLRKAY